MLVSDICTPQKYLLDYALDYLSGVSRGFYANRAHFLHLFTIGCGSIAQISSLGLMHSPRLETGFLTGIKGYSPVLAQKPAFSVQDDAL
jgi:hypothetical protein